MKYTRSLSELTLLILNINAAIDTGKYQDISVEEIEKHIEDRDIFDFLKQRTDMDLSLYGSHIPLVEIINELEDILCCYRGQERRKWGVENSGLCLLLAWINEYVQRSVSEIWKEEKNESMDNKK